MRINKFIAANSNFSRRRADEVIAEGRIEINDLLAKPGDLVIDTDKVTLDGKVIIHNQKITTIILNKPVGYVVSRNGQGSKTVYELLPGNLQTLNPVGRLDKNSSGLLLLTNDGNLANQLTHPSFTKIKLYQLQLNRSLSYDDITTISTTGVDIGDGKPSKFAIVSISQQSRSYQVSLTEGRNRQIRRTFEALGYRVVKLHRTNFGPYSLDHLTSGKFITIDQ